MSDPISNFSELLSNPLGDLISSVGKGVGEAQAAMDAGSISATLDIYREDDAAGRTAEEQRMIDLIRDIGYQPTFYAIPETEVEAQVSLSMTLTSNTSSTLTSIPLAKTAISKFSVIATPMNAGNVNRFGISGNAIAKLKFKIVPVPPPASVSDKRVVPDLIGKDLDDDTIALIAQLGFTYSIDGTLSAGTIATQSPAGQEIVIAGTEIVLTLV